VENMRYLYGSKRDTPSKLVATFDSEQQLLAYVRWATLESSSDAAGKFEQGSALASYASQVCFEIETPRDREGSFEPRVIKKYPRRVEGFDRESSSCMPSDDYKGISVVARQAARQFFPTLR
jgi:hypothetical protein